MDAIMELLAAKVGTFTGKIDDIGIQSVQNVYDHQQTYYFPQHHYPDFYDHQISPWSYNNPVSIQPEFSYSNLQPQEQQSSLEELLAKSIEQNDIRMYNQEVSMPTLVSYPELWYQPPQQQEEESKMEELLTMFIEQNEVRMNNQEASIRNIADQLEQLTDAVINSPQWSLPSNPETNPEYDGEEHCDEFYVAIGGNCEKSYPSVEDVSDTSYMGSKIGEYEDKGEDNQVENSIGFVQIPSVPLEPVLYSFQNFGEYFRVEIVENDDKMEEVPRNYNECFRVEIVKSTVTDKANEESYFLPIDDINFWGDLRSCLKANQNKEKTNRRHDVMNFARNPD